jgi:WD40 repeat protein
MSENLKESLTPPIYSMTVSNTGVVVVGGKDKLVYCHSDPDKPSGSISNQGGWARSIAIQPSKIAWCNEAQPLPKISVYRVFDRESQTISEEKTDAPCRGVGFLAGHVVAALENGELKMFGGNEREEKASAGISEAVFSKSLVAVSLDRPVNSQAIAVYDSKLNKVAEMKHERAVTRLAISPNGSLVAGADSHQVLIWELQRALRSGSATFKYDVKPVTAMAFSHDDSQLALGVADKSRQIYLWDLKKGKDPRQFGHGQGIVTALQFSDSDEYLYSVDVKGDLRRWFMARGDAAKAK